MIRAVPPGGNWRQIPETIPSKRLEQIRRTASEGLGSRSTYYGRLRWDKPSYTISTYFNRPGNGAFIHPDADRLLTVREAARLQTFPDSFRFCGAGRTRFVQVGNAVPPLLAYQVAGALPRSQVVDLFAGAGGFSLGFRWAGHEIIVAADNEPEMIRALNFNHGDTESIVADLGHREGVNAVREAVARRGGMTGGLIVIGGPPCQGFSTAGQNLSDDPRNKLAFAFAEQAISMNPTHVLMENVPALAFSSRRHVLNAIRHVFHLAGYETEVVVAHAESFGVPQLRRRLFLQAARGGQAIAWPSPWLRASPPRQPSAGLLGTGADLDGALTVQDAISDLPVRTADGPDQPIDYASRPESNLQRWARGLLRVEELVPIVNQRSPHQLTLASLQQ